MNQSVDRPEPFGVLGGDFERVYATVTGAGTAAASAALVPLA